MRTPEDVDAMRKTSFTEQLKAKDERASSGSRIVRAEKDEVYAEGVEAALLWVLGDAGSPFPR